MTVTRVKSEGFPTSATIVLGDLTFVHARISWHSHHVIVEAKFQNGTLEMSAPALLDFVREGQTALATPVPGSQSDTALADYRDDETHERPTHKSRG